MTKRQRKDRKRNRAYYLANADALKAKRNARYRALVLGKAKAA